MNSETQSKSDGFLVLVAFFKYIGIFAIIMGVILNPLLAQKIFFIEGGLSNKVEHLLHKLGLVLVILGFICHFGARFLGRFFSVHSNFFAAGLGVLIPVGFWYVLELLFFAQSLNQKITNQHYMRNDKGVFQPSSDYFEKDSNLGYKPAKDSETISERHYSERVSLRKPFDPKLEVFSATYKHNGLNHRITPGNKLTARDFSVFFGGSFTYGQGVDQGETTASIVSKNDADLNVHNLAYIGYGTQAMLAFLQDENSTEAFKKSLNNKSLNNSNSKRCGIYFFIDHHLSRVIGASDLMSWGASFPYYRLDQNDQIQRLGSFENGRPYTTKIYRFLDRSFLLKKFQIGFPVNRESAYPLFARIVSEAQALYKRKFESKCFYVVIYPGSATAAKVKKALLAEGVTEVLDLSQIPWNEKAHTYGPYDSHPSARGHAVVAKHVIKLMETIRK